MPLSFDCSLKTCDAVAYPSTSILASLGPAADLGLPTCKFKFAITRANLLVPIPTASTPIHLTVPRPSSLDYGTVPSSGHQSGWEAANGNGA